MEAPPTKDSIASEPYKQCSPLVSDAGPGAILYSSSSGTSEETARAALTRILAKGFGVYNEEEMLLRAFRSVDVDNSGLIEVSEAPKIARLFYGDMPHTDETMRAYNWMDRNKDGAISFDEFKSILMPLETTTKLVKIRDEDGNKHINEYVVRHVLGQGAFGKVKEVKSTKDNGLYAMKQISKSRLKKPKKRGDPPPMLKFQAELDIMKKLRHPNVIRLYEIIDDDEFDKLYLIMEYAGGGSLGPDEITTPYEHPEKLWNVVRQLLLGLDFLHNQGVLHRDIKPANILLTKGDETVKFCDFNVSKLLKDGQDDFVTGTEGTPAFYSPEMCAGGSYSGKAADVWALGVTIYALAYGAIPFPNPSLMTLFDDIVKNEVPFPETIDPNLRNLLMLMLEKSPEKRATLDDCKSSAYVTKNNTCLLVQVPMGALMELRRTDSIVERLSKFAFDKPSVVDRMKRFASRKKSTLDAQSALLGMDSGLSAVQIPSGLHMLLDLNDMSDVCKVIFEELCGGAAGIDAKAVERLLKMADVPVTPELVQQALGELDIDKSGAICFKELFSGFAGGDAVNSVICETVNRLIFSNLKEGKEPPIAWKGVKGATAKWLDGSKPPHEQLNALQMRWFKDEFSKCDVDRDGSVVVQEIEQILKKYKPMVSTSQLELKAKEIIKETNGPMDFPAFVTFLTKYKLTKVSNAFDIVLNKK